MTWTNVFIVLGLVVNVFPVREWVQEPFPWLWPRPRGNPTQPNPDPVTGENIRTLIGQNTTMIGQNDEMLSKIDALAGELREGRGHFALDSFIQLRAAVSVSNRPRDDGNQADANGQ